MPETAPSETPEPIDDFDKQIETNDDWDKVMELFRVKADIWIQRDNGKWVMGEILAVNEDGNDNFTVYWPNPGSEMGYAKNVRAETILKWQEEAPVSTNK